MGRVTRLLRTAAALWCLAAASGCASAPVSPPVTAAPASAAPPAVTAAPAGVDQEERRQGVPVDRELPEGRGKQILMASCTSCHDLREVTKFRGFYSRAQWHDIVVTMVEYGADVGKKDVEVLADYLTEHLGRSG